MSTKSVSLNERWLSAAVLMVVFGFGALFALYMLDQQRRGLPGSVKLSYLPKGEYLKFAALGYRNIVADLLWLKAVQGLSGRQQSREGYLGAYHAADVLTDLDPQFVHAYQYTGTVLGVIAGMPKESVALLEKGVRHNPSVWQLSFFLGYDYYYELGDPINAAKHFQAAALLPGSPPWLAGLAARMSVEGNDPNTAVEFLQRIYSQTQDVEVREGLDQRIREASVERDIRLIEAGIKTFRDKMGKSPETLEDLVRSGILASIPLEPFGGRYEYSHEDGSVKSSNLRERLLVHRR